MASEVLIQMGSQKAFAASELLEGRFFTWANVVEHVRYTTEGERPVGIIIDSVVNGKILSVDGSAEWFMKAGIVRVLLDLDIAIGTQIMAGSNGTIVAHTGTNYAAGVVLTARNADGESELWIY